MTLLTTTNRVDYTGTGLVSSYPYTFRIFATTDLVVTQTDTDGNETTLVLNTDYTVTGAGSYSYGNVVLTTALAADYGLAIRRVVPRTQTTNLRNQGKFYAETHEDAFDRLTMIDQQQEEEITRSLKLPVSVTGDGQLTDAPEEGTVLGWVSGVLRNLAAGSASLAANLLNAVNVALGDALVAVAHPFTGATARTQHEKNQDILTSLDFPDIADAISGIGADKVVFIVMSPVTVVGDLTIPANVTLRVEGDGLITVTSGKRLFINGPFQAHRLQQCFASSLLTTSLTASVNGNALVITAASADVLAEGQVIAGTDILEGQIILKAYGVTGVGTVSLSSYNGVLTSRAITATGPSVIFAKGTVECAYPQWWGAVGDGVTDNLIPIKQAVLSMPWGGRVHFPAGNYKVLTGSIVLHPQIQITGDGATDNSTGSPESTATVPSYVWLGTDNAKLFVAGGACSHIQFRDLAIGAQQAFGGALSTPTGTGRKGIVFSGHYPQTIFSPRIENVWFSGLASGILVDDSWAINGDGVGAAGTYWNGSASVAYFDWAVNPGLVVNCHFLVCQYGVLFNTSNADGWKVSDSVFILPANSYGVLLTRCGYLKMDNCFAFGLSMTASKFVGFALNGVGSVDSVLIDNCQAEDCANFLNLETSSTNDVPPTITVRNSIHQMGADISLGRACDYISQGNEILSYVYAIAAGVRIHSFVDKFFATDFVPGHATWGFNWTSGGDANAVYTYVPGYYPNSSFSGPISMGLRTSYGTAAPVAGTWAAGDRMVYSPPTVGQPKAWSCTVAGTPGTWVSEGNL